MVMPATPSRRTARILSVRGRPAGLTGLGLACAILAGCSSTGSGMAGTGTATGSASSGATGGMTTSATSSPSFPSMDPSAAAQAERALASASAAAASLLARASTAAAGAKITQANGDAQVMSCGANPMGALIATVSVTNPTSQVQSYAVWVIAHGSDGSTLATLVGAAPRVAAGKSQRITAAALVQNPPSTVTCTVSRVIRAGV